MLPTTFLASSSESIEIKKAVRDDFADKGSVSYFETWDQNVFKLSDIIIDSLSKSLNKCDFAIFVLAADDFTEIRGTELYTVRDNVTLELGMAIGALGRERCFILRPESIQNLRIAPDLGGVVLGIYSDIIGTNITPEKAVSNVCSKIERRIKELGIRKRVLDESLIKENISFVSHRREHSTGSKRFWHDAKKSVDILAPTFFNTIRGLTNTAQLPDHLKVLNNDKISVRMALLHPESEALPLHSKFLAKSAEGGLSENYEKQIRIFMDLTTNKYFEIRFYDFYPTTSYVIVDGNRCKVDILLPHAGIDSRPVIEGQKGSDGDQNFFSSIEQNFSDIWANSKEL